MATLTVKITAYSSMVITYSTSSTNDTYTLTISSVKFTNSRSGGTSKALSGDLTMYDSMSTAVYANVLDYTIGNNVTFSIPKGTKSKTVSISGRKVTWRRTTSSQSAPIKFDCALTSGGVVEYEKVGSLSVTVPALPSYTVSFNANGGSGAPSAQTKWYGITLALSSTRPTRTGYTFVGWATSSGSSTVAYSPGASYTANAAATLYAVWQINTFAVTYNGNGSTGGSTSAQTKTYGTALALRSNGFTRTNYQFAGWNTKADGTGTAYAAGASYTADSAVTLYAQWSRVYDSPSLAIVRSYRCDSQGDVADEGTYAAVVLAWSIYDTGSNSVQALSATVNGVTATATPSGLSGTTTLVVAANMSASLAYAVSASVTDAGCATSGVTGSSATTTRTDSISTAYFPVDFRAGGHGAGIGTAANEEGVCRIQHSLRVLDDSGNTVLLVKKDGTVTVSNPAAWRSALGI